VYFRTTTQRALISTTHLFGVAKTVDKKGRVQHLFGVMETMNEVSRVLHLFGVT